MSTAKKLAERLALDGKKNIDFFQDLDRDAREYMVYSDGSCWTVKELLAHFVESEKSLTLLISGIVKGEEGVPEGFDINRYNESQVPIYANKPFSDLLDEFASLREQTVEIVLGFGEDDLSRSGRHPFLGVTEVKEMLKLMYLHHQIHRRDIRKILEEKNTNNT
jgi:hypothetical protein